MNRCIDCKKILWDINWGITLCKKCHRDINERWENK